MDLSNERWESLTPAEREASARRLAMQLPSGFAFGEIRDCGPGEQQRSVALFQQDNAAFVLIPGGEVSIGYDADRPWEPNPEERESWEETAEEYGIAESLQEYIAGVTLRVRQVELPPLLVETAAGEVGWEAVEIDDRQVQEIIRLHRSRSHVTVSDGETSTRVRRGPDGSVIAERSLSRTHEELAAELHAEGFRFPTSDEWEYACGGGARTLFRWGDHVPCDRYPTDASPAETFAPDWDLHRRPNSFGLFIASDPYKCELVAETGVTRGGDGGGMICGGAGFFIGWLTLATAYFEEDSCKLEPDEPVPHGYTIGRRVLELR